MNLALLALLSAANAPLADLPAIKDCEGGAWVCQADYPFLARKMGWDGTVEFILKVNRAGKVSNCDILTSSGHEILDRQTCRILISRANFEPAHDENGNAAETRFVSKMRWTLPEK